MYLVHEEVGDEIPGFSKNLSIYSLSFKSFFSYETQCIIRFVSMGTI
ncbi:hypothetical protein K2D_25490 [Enterococcus hirae]|nr:hypothetical protein K2D_25490 [Enterococcus hirae]